MITVCKALGRHHIFWSGHEKSLEFGTDGIHGPVSEKGISPEFALKLGIATGATLKSYQETVDVVIGRI